MVFWASLVPWASDTSEAEPTCPHRNPASRRCSGTLVTILNTIQVPNPATTPATTGEKIAGSTIELITPSHFTPPMPSAAMVAPIRPPNSACEDDEGKPKSQVNKFHKMPPTSPARMITSSGPQQRCLRRSPDQCGSGIVVD